MGKPKKPDPPVDDVPVWLMTYSDVITLLMTFFILLMTFSTSEPETFERMQKSMFGGGGASGIAGPTGEPIDKEAVLLRVRPRSARLSTRGTSMPPIEDDPAQRTLDKGLESLADEDSLIKEDAIHLPITMILDQQLNPTEFGKSFLHKIAVQAKKTRSEIRLASALPDNVDTLVKVTDYLHLDEQVPVGHVSMAESVGANTAIVVLLRKQ